MKAQLKAEQSHLSDADYAEVLRTLSEGSVHTHFDAFTDIDWNHPDWYIDPKDPRWVLPTADPLGGHPWYQNLPVERQAEVGLIRMANIAKVGMQFENVLIRGAMDYLFSLPNGKAEFRYLTHECTEETHHTQMFQEFVNRSGCDVPGGRPSFRVLSRFLPLAGSLWPEVFFTGVLAGEEPIDHLQKAVLREGGPQHPMLRRIMQIHIAEEARHISFAHEFLKRRTPQLSRTRRALLSIVFPVVMRVLGDVITIPGKEVARQMGVPHKVLREVFWKSPSGEKMLRDVFADVRMLAQDAGLMNPVSRRVWKALRIDGRPSRHRGEPASLAA
ncbi:diiron oxygenase [Streptomyces sp. NA04227]|uniref:AurF N-oxygenase family protein n=1 Tax=Streptomyces sp. NA04227 TaxID=2742136 RepID=UPI001591FC4A|nr:diiron oxygenase [Streptomyces sp. NA04227]QKW06334.1 diiron oxygenase [Streptomyces sp. NA04227]